MTRLFLFIFLGEFRLMGVIEKKALYCRTTVTVSHDCTQQYSASGHLKVFDTENCGLDSGTLYDDMEVEADSCKDTVKRFGTMHPARITALLSDIDWTLYGRWPLLINKPFRGGKIYIILLTFNPDDIIRLKMAVTFFLIRNPVV